MKTVKTPSTAEAVPLPQTPQAAGGGKKMKAARVGGFRAHSKLSLLTLLSRHSKIMTEYSRGKRAN